MTMTMMMVMMMMMNDDDNDEDDIDYDDPSIGHCSRLEVLVFMTMMMIRHDEIITYRIGWRRMIVIRASVNYAKDGLDQLFLFPGLVHSSSENKLLTPGGGRGGGRTAQQSPLRRDSPSE